MGMFEEVDEIPAGQKPLGLKWVFDYKYLPDGNIIVGKEKACLCVQGFNQHPEDFSHMASPIAHIDSIHWAFAFAALHNWELNTFNFKTAFLNAPLKHNVYVKQVPTWPDTSSPHHVY
ncbi:retrotransposon unclassified [Moniliophthora roreri MCA 2997]|nr:retrotransposon unclassified [Moniliophthora roreri MCA 2997]